MRLSGFAVLTGLLLLSPHVGIALEGESVTGPPKVVNVPIQTINAGVLAKGRMEVRLHWKHISMDKLYEDGHRVDPEDVLARGVGKVPEELDIDTGILRVYYGLWKDFRVCTVVPYLRKDLTTLTKNGVSRSSASGLGDIKLTGKYKFFSSDTGDQFGLHLGVKLPTGSTEEKDGDGNKLPPRMQLGTGSTDPFIGILYTKNMTPYWFHANIHYTFTTENPDGYEYGDLLTGDLALQYQVQSPFVLNMEINGESAAKDKSHGVEVANTGGSKVFLSPGVQYKPFPGTVLEFSYQAPVWQELNGRQLAEGYRILLGLKYNFSLL